MALLQEYNSAGSKKILWFNVCLKQTEWWKDDKICLEGEKERWLCWLKNRNETNLRLYSDQTKQVEVMMINIADMELQEANNIYGFISATHDIYWHFDLDMPSQLNCKNQT